MDINEVKQVEQESDCLCSTEMLHQALDKMAAQITADLNEDNPLVLCVMTGGIIPVGHLLTRLSFPLQLDYVHATRYQGETRGGELYWRQKPSIALQGRTVLLVDDILDEGITLNEIRKYCLRQGAAKVLSAVLVNKQHDRKIDYRADYVALDIEDRYVFGFGMDYKHYLRNLNAIHAVKGL